LRMASILINETVCTGWLGNSLVPHPGHLRGD